MSNSEAQKIHAAHEAATWYLLQEDGLSEAELRRYLRWRKSSPENVEAMRYLERLCDSLRTKRKRTYH